MSPGPDHRPTTLVVRLQQAIAVARIHDVWNVALTDAVKELKTALADAHAISGFVSIKADPAAVVVFFNDRALRATRHLAQTFEGVTKLFDTFGTGELRFERPLAEDPLRELLALLRARQEGEDGRAAFRRVESGIATSAALRGAVTIVSAEDAALQAKLKAARKKVVIPREALAKMTYARTLVLLREYLSNLHVEEMRRYFWQRVQRAAVALAGLAEDRGRDLMILTRVHDADDHVYNHPLNVCLLAVLLGKRLGLPKPHLALVGLAGLLHPIGKVRLDPALLAKADGDRTEAERREYARHPYDAVGEVLDLQCVDDVALATAVLLFSADGDDVPRRRTAGKGHALAEVVGICEAYDTLIAPRPGGRGVSPAEAVEMLLRGEPRAFHTTLVRAFVGLVGLFPAGSAVALDDGSIGVVLQPSEARPKQPIVALLRDGAGQELDAAVVNLAKEGARSVAGSVDLRLLGIAVPEQLGV